MIRKPYWKCSSCQCSFLVSKGFIPDLAVMVKHRCCCFTTDVLHRERGYVAKYLYLLLPYFKTMVTLCILKPHLPVFPSIWPTWISLFCIYTCVTSPWSTPSHTVPGEKVWDRRDGLDEMYVVPVALANENWPNYFVLLTLMWFRLCHIPTLNWSYSCPIGKEAVLCVTWGLRWHFLGLSFRQIGCYPDILNMCEENKVTDLKRKKRIGDSSLFGEIKQ